MVICLARWIRAAGYEAFTPHPGASDQSIVEFVLKNNLFLITRDRILSERRDLRGRCLLLTSNDMDSWVEELNHRNLINWQKNPMSRCFVCNGGISRLTPTSPVQIPQWVSLKYQETFFCEHCHRVYWKGSHYWKILDQLADWAVTEEQLNFESGPKTYTVG